MAQETLTLTVEPEMDDAGRGRAASVFLLLRTAPEQIAGFLEGHSSLADVQKARDALIEQKEGAAAATAKAGDGKEPEVAAPNPHRLYVAHCVTALLEHCDMLNVALNPTTGEAVRRAVARDAASARPAGGTFDATVAQLRAVADLATRMPLIVEGLPEFDRQAIAPPEAAPPLAA